MDQNLTPAISVIMPVYNAETFIYDSVTSVLNQTFKDFEFIIINDNSTDATLKILNQFLVDPRVNIISNEENLKIVKSLNIGIAMAKGEYIARMDADDICKPDRFLIQYNFAKLNNYDFLGASAEYLINLKKGSKIEVPTQNNDIIFSFFITNPFIHPTIFIKRKIIKKYLYNVDALYVEDLDLWARLISDGINFGNLDIILLKYRFSKNQTSNRFSQLQFEKSIQIRVNLLANFYSFDKDKISNFLSNIQNNSVKNEEFNVCMQQIIEIGNHNGVSLRVVKQVILLISRYSVSSSGIFANIIVRWARYFTLKELYLIFRSYIKSLIKKFNIE